ncbi:MAG: carbohydrate porin [Nitrosomonadales bacterium]|nr:carbohydrate porin [Nitrosomonadales bacterium]
MFAAGTYFQRVNFFLFTLLVFSWLTGSANAAEENSPDWGSETLTGDWGGTRSNLYSKGISLEFNHKSDVLTNTSGGIKRGTAWMGYTDARIRMDMEKLLDWDATTAFIQYHSELGSKFNQDYIDSFVSVNNIEVGTNTAQFLHAWLQKNFFDDSLSVLAGLYAVDSEFYVTDTSGVFTQTPYGMANDLGQASPPIYPVGALAMRVKYTSSSQNFYLQGALTDGVPGDPNNPHGTHIKLGNGDGTLSIIEFGYTPQTNEQSSESANQDAREESESFNKTAIGFWNYSARADDQDPANVGVRRQNRGAYFLAERTLLAERDHPSQGLSGFVRFGVANKDIHQADWTGSLGLHYLGLFAGYDDDIAAIGITVSHASEPYQRINASLGSETSVEATYRAQVKPWLALQPTLQYVRHPNMNPATKDAWVVGVRLEAAL